MKTKYLSSIPGLILMGFNRSFDIEHFYPSSSAKLNDILITNTDIEVSYVDLTDFEISEIIGGDGSIN